MRLSSLFQIPDPVAVMLKEDMIAGTLALVLGLMWMPLKNPEKLTTECSFLLCDRGASETHTCQFPSRPTEEVYFWSFHGRSRNSDLCFKKSWKIQICVSICSNLQPGALSLGERGHALRLAADSQTLIWNFVPCKLNQAVSIVQDSQYSAGTFYPLPVVIGRQQISFYISAQHSHVQNLSGALQSTHC